ncbi:Superoxide dismutase [Mn] [Durusdinium trenchii]|uniref:Superoxide dismutase [Fe] n=1 Tax=Durusdinium trenchii TaxID=1381693 RepID=A0ABP0QT44_9DINO
MKQVKEALAAKLKRPEVTRNGRMVVENPSGELLPVPDGQRLGGKRQVFMVGITLSPAPASPAPRGAAAAGTAQDVQRFVTPLSYRMKRNKENSEENESQSTGIEAEDAGSDPECLTASKSACRMITPLELSRKTDVQRRGGAGAKGKAKAKALPRPNVPKPGKPGIGARADRKTTAGEAPASDASAFASAPLQTGPPQRVVRATVVPPPSAPLAPVPPVPDLSASMPLASPRGAYTVSVPIAYASRMPRSSSPAGLGTPDRPIGVPTVALAPGIPATVDPVSGLQRQPGSCSMPRFFAQSCSVPSLLTTTKSPEPVPSLAQVVIQQLNTPSREVRRSIACPLTARARLERSEPLTAVVASPRAAAVVAVPGMARGARAQKGSPRRRIADFKPLLKELFEDEPEAQSAQQLQNQIEQLQKLQKLLQRQQEGLKQQQKAQSYQPAHRDAASPRGGSKALSGLRSPLRRVPKSNDAEPKATRDRPLNLGEAKELLKAFREIASSKEFQRTLGNIHKQGPDSVQKMQPIFIAQSFNRTMAMYDFPLTTEGYQDMARGIGKHAWNVHVKAQAHEVERLLRMPPGAFFGIPGEPGQEIDSVQSGFHPEPEYPPLEPDPPKPKAAGRPAAPKPAPAVGRAGGIEGASRREMAAGLATGLVGLLSESARAYDLPDLPYAYDALEPSIDKATMEFHHDKHHLTYVTNINKAMEGKSQPPLVELQKSAIKDGAAFRNSGGGAYNHNFFWLEMAPTGKGGKPSEKLSKAIDDSFGSMDDFKAKFEAAGAPGARFGSGWVWLVVTDDKKLAITSTPNQDNPLMDGVEGTAGIPILGCDVWEHAYYLKYQYRRPDYIKAWWDVVNWDQVSAWYEDALGGKAPTADSVRVELPQNATFYDCKQAISKLLGRDARVSIDMRRRRRGDHAMMAVRPFRRGRDEILRKGRLVQKKGGLYSAYKDDDFVGETRQVLVLGADLQTVQPDEPMPPVHPYADVGRPPSRPLKGESDDEGPPRPQPYSVRSRVHEELEAAPRVNDLPQTPMPPPPPQLQPKPTPKPKPKPVPRPPQEYEITIKHAVEPGEVQLKIWSNWTFAAVRDALAKKLRREEIQKRARFVFKAGTGTAPWVAFKDDEIVGWTHEGHRREELMLLGVELVEQEVSSGPVSVELTRKLLEEFEKACAQEEVQAQLQKLIDRQKLSGCRVRVLLPAGLNTHTQ